MHAEMQCQHEGCTATLPDMDMFNGENPEYGWTWWEQSGRVTCPAHYVDGLAQEGEARSDRDGC